MGKRTAKIFGPLARIIPTLCSATSLRRGALAAGSLAAVAAVWYGLACARDYARATLQTDWDRIRLTEQPGWIAVPLKERILARSTLPRRFSVLEPGIAKRLARAFALEPWIKRVVRVRLFRSGEVVVEVEYREPVAVVQQGNKLVPVDAEAVVLPVGEVTAWQVYPRVVVGRSARAPSPGLSWESEAVRAAAALAAFLAPYQHKLQVILIDATRYRGDAPPTGPIVLETRGGSRIVWGRPPGTSYPGELAAEQKLQRLLDYVDQFGSLEAPSGPYEIDVTRWTGMSRRLRSVTPWQPVEP